MVDKKQSAVILLSGGLDSATVAAIAQSEGYALHGLSFQYGQRHGIELEAAKRLAQERGIEDHRIATIDLTLFGKSALTDKIDVPKGRDETTMGDDIPVTYVPARNTIFLSFALAFAEVVEAQTIFIGVNALDYSGYPDCRPAYIKAYEDMANLATRAGVTDTTRMAIKTPLIHKTKAEIIQIGTDLGLDYSQTISCYDPDPDGKACGTCDSCILRRNGFDQAGIKDPTLYQSSVL